MKARLTLIPVIAVTAMALATGKAEARGENELVRLTHSIEDIAAELKDEFRIHYRHSSAYRHLMSDVSQILAEAGHIDSLAHNPHSSLRHIKADLEDLDDLAHHLHDLVDAVDRGRYSGHVDGNTRHVHSLLSSLNGTIHHMERVVAAYAAPPVHRHRDSHDHHSDHRSDRSRIIRSVVGAIFEKSGGHHGHGH